jgi:hypothetical protein
MKPSDYILTLEKDRVNKFEKMGFAVYAVGDGTYYAVDADAPQESHDLAVSAIEGYSDAIDDVRGFKLPEQKDEQPLVYKGNASSIASALNLR